MRATAPAFRRARSSSRTPRSVPAAPRAGRARRSAAERRRSPGARSAGSATRRSGRRGWFPSAIGTSETSRSIPAAPPSSQARSRRSGRVPSPRQTAIRLSAIAPAATISAQRRVLSSPRSTRMSANGTSTKSAIAPHRTTPTGRSQGLVSAHANRIETPARAPMLIFTEASATQSRPSAAIARRDAGRDQQDDDGDQRQQQEADRRPGVQRLLRVDREDEEGDQRAERCDHDTARQPQQGDPGEPGRGQPQEQVDPAGALIVEGDPEQLHRSADERVEAGAVGAEEVVVERAAVGEAAHHDDRVTLVVVDVDRAEDPLVGRVEEDRDQADDHGEPASVCHRDSAPSRGSSPSIAAPV